jgi:DNA-binding transcriptional LysR family regulator
MRLNSAQLEAFKVIAKTLNFTKAADELHVTQSALSQRIAKLEEELETALFVRDRTSIRLTDVGYGLLRYCEISEAAENDFRSELLSTGKKLGGVLRLGGFSSVMRSMVLPALSKLASENEDLAISFMTKEISELNDLLRRSEVDYIVTSQKSSSPDVESEFLGVEENVLVMSKHHADIDVFLDHDERDPTTKGYFKQNKLEIKNKRMRYLDDVYGLLDGVKHGYGKAILPKQLVADQKDLRVIDPKRVLKVPVYLNYFSQPYYRKLHQPVINALKQHFARSF